MEITFPPTFFWGIASAAHQVEGGNVYNDNWWGTVRPGPANGGFCIDLEKRVPVDLMPDREAETFAKGSWRFD